MVVVAVVVVGGGGGAQDFKHVTYLLVFGRKQNTFIITITKIITY